MDRAQEQDHSHGAGELNWVGQNTTLVRVCLAFKALYGPEGRYSYPSTASGCSPEADVIASACIQVSVGAESLVTLAEARCGRAQEEPCCCAAAPHALRHSGQEHF